MRKLATIRQISSVSEIENSDYLELLTVDSWQVVAKKNEYKSGDMVVYCEVDSFLPIKDEFEFLRKTSYKKMGDLEGFRLRTIKLRGTLSQGLVLPLIVLPEGGNYVEGDDVAEVLGIIKYEQPIPAELAGTVKGGFPSFIRKTDEERVQNLWNKNIKTWSGNTFYLTEKLDGASATYYVKDGVFGVCSRNLELEDPGEFVDGMVMCADGVERLKKENTFWKVAKNLSLQEKMLGLNRNIALQGELIGEGIQGNRYGCKGQTVKFFNAFDIDNQRYFEFDEFIDVVKELKLDTVPILTTDFRLPNTVEEVIKMADGFSVFNEKAVREGIVIRTKDRKISFKVISNEFLLLSE